MSLGFKAMRLIVHKFYYPDSRTEKRQKPSEDYILMKDNTFAVFDGVSLLFQEPYPNPSPAAEASEVAAKAVVEVIEKALKKGEAGSNLIRAAFSEANLRVRQLNRGLGVTSQTVNHLDKQYASTVGAFGFFQKDSLYFGQVNDSGVMVFDPLGNREVDFVLNQTPYINFLSKLEAKDKFKPGSKEEHVFVRSQVVNNPDLEFEGIKINFGVINGSKEASKFLRLGMCNVMQGQVALFYTDGFIPFVYDQSFVDLLFKAEDFEEVERFIKNKEKEEGKFQKEKSMIILKFF